MGDADAFFPANSYLLGSVVYLAYLPSPAPEGWLTADGAAVSRTIYADLFGLLGTGWGVGDGSTTFNLPDLRSRVPIGAGIGAPGSLSPRAVGATGGSENISVADLPPHNHGGLTTAAGGHTHTLPGGVAIAGTSAIAQVAAGASFAAINTWGTTDNPGNHQHTIPTEGNTVNGNRMPPFVGIWPLIRVMP